MELNIVSNNGTAYITVSGRLNNTYAAEFEAALNDIKEKDIVMDFSSLEYISSAGLRVLLAVLKRAEQEEGSLIIKNPNPMVVETFEMTGFINMITIE